MDQLSANINKGAIRRTVEALTNKRKVVPVIGAGISITCGVPSGTSLMGEMRHTLRQIAGTKAFTDKFSCQVQTIKESLFSHSSVPSFEWLMSIYSDFYNPDHLYKWLSERIPARNTIRRVPPIFPTFAHEILAHFVATGLIRHIITTNFDEILETAFEEEFGPAGYLAIASESEFARFAGLKVQEWDREIGEPRPQCYVLKPHGTVSRQLSLRHTPGQVNCFTWSKQAAMHNLLEGGLLLFLGFGNYNEDFWLLLGQASKPFPSVVIVAPNADAVRSRFSFAQTTTEMFCYTGTCDDFFRDLTADLYRGDVRIKIHSRPIRHEIRSRFFNIFSPVCPLPRDSDLQRAISSKRSDLSNSWVSQRIYELELLIYLFKTRGLFVDLSVTNCARIRYALDYCWMHREGLNVETLRPFEVLHKILNRNGERIVQESFVIDRLALRALAARWIFLLVPSGFTGPSVARMPTIAKVAAEQFADHILCQLSLPDNQSLELWQLRLQEFSKHLAVHLEQLSHEFDIDITSEDLSTPLSFSNPTRLLMREQLARQSGNLIMEGKWNHLRVATVAGEWHADQLRKLSPLLQEVPYHIEIMTDLDMFTAKTSIGPTVASIAPDHLYHYQHVTDSVAELLRSLCSWPAVTLEWFGYRNLEHHMTLVSKQDKPKSGLNEEFLSGVYFRRPGKSTSISPVFLSEQEDLKSLAEYYDSRTHLARKGSIESWKRGVGRIFQAVKKEDVLVITLTRDSPQIFESLYKALADKLAAEIGSGQINIH